MIAILLAWPALGAEPLRYGVNPGDALNVFVWNDEALSSTIRVAPDGTISYPLVGSISVIGQTTPQIAETIATALDEYLKDRPVVTVSLEEAAGNQIYVLGEVRQPGVYVMSRSMTAAQALALAGGTTEYASTGSIKVIRDTEAGERTLQELNYDRLKSGRDLSQDIPLKAGDLIIVP